MTTDWLKFARDVAAAADLDDADRQDVNMDLDLGNPDLAILDAVVGSRSPLPAAMLNRIRSDIVDQGWYSGSDHKLIVDALDRQRRQLAVA